MLALGNTEYCIAASALRLTAPWTARLYYRRKVKLYAVPKYRHRYRYRQSSRVSDSCTQIYARTASDTMYSLTCYKVILRCGVMRCNSDVTAECRASHGASACWLLPCRTRALSAPHSHRSDLATHPTVCTDYCRPSYCRSPSGVGQVYCAAPPSITRHVSIDASAPLRRCACRTSRTRRGKHADAKQAYASGSVAVSRAGARSTASARRCHGPCSLVWSRLSSPPVEATGR